MANWFCSVFNVACVVNSAWAVIVPGQKSIKNKTTTKNEKIPENGQETKYVTLPYIGHYSNNATGEISDST